MERSVDEKNSRSKNSLVRPTPIPRSPKVNEVVKREGIEKEKPLLKRMCYVKEKEIVNSDGKVQYTAVNYF